MTVTDHQLQAFIFLIRECRRWDTGGTVAALERIRHWTLPEAFLEVATAAADPHVDGPGVIGRQGRRFAGVAPTPPPERLGRHERCTVCSLSEPACRIRWAADHDFARPAPPPRLDTHRVVQAIKDEVAAKRPEPTPEPVGLAGIENSPRVVEMKEAMAAAREAAAKALEDDPVAAQAVPESEGTSG